MIEPNFWRIEEGIAIPLNYGTKTLSDAAKYTPTGAYTSFRTYDRFGVLRLSKHLDRLEETSRLAGFDIRLDKNALKKTLTQLIRESSGGEKRVRVMIDLEKSVGTIYIAMEALKTPAPEKYREGILCRTAEAHRDNPKAKLSSFLARADGIRGQEQEAFDEILMYTAEGYLLEGLSSNFYAVKNGTVFTAEEGVLSGTTRDFILKIADERNFPVTLLPVNKADLSELDEAFISSTSRAILPIRSIDGVLMRAGAPGPVTKRLMIAFASALAAGIERLDE